MNIAFKHPEFLYFLFALLIPIIIHLFSFRKYKKVFFHNIHLLKNIQQEQNKTRTKLKHLLILIARILTFACLIFAFAQPYIPQNKEHNTPPQDNIIAIYIDNSFSSQSESKNGTVIDFAKKKAQQIVNGYPATQKFYLCVNNPYDLENTILTKDQIQKQISQITVTPHTKNISEVYKKIQSLQLQDKKPITLFLISDFQKYSSDFNQIPKDSLITSQAIALESEHANNLLIDSCWFSSPYRMASQPENLYVSITNNSTESYNNIPLKLFINDTLKAISNFSIEPHKRIQVVINYATKSVGILSLKLEIEDYPIIYDNTYYLSYSIDSKVPILCLFDKKPNPYIQALFSKNNYISITNKQSTSIDYTSLSNYSVIILDGLETISSGLSQTVFKNIESGTTVLCIPSEKSDITSYNSFFAQFGNQRFLDIDTVKTAISNIEYNHVVFKNVFSKKDESAQLPIVKKYFPFVPQTHTNIIQLKNKNPFLTQIASNQGSLFVCTSPLTLQCNQFISSPLFIGFFNIALYVSNSADMQTYIGKPFHIEKPNIGDDDILHITNPTKNIDFIPQIISGYNSTQLTLHPISGIKESGNYFITYKSKKITGISFNYDRNESQNKFYDASEIQEQFEKNNIPNFSMIESDNEIITEKIIQTNLGIQLWRYLILLTVIFILTEVALIRFMK